MALQKQNITYSLGIGGSDQKTDPKFVPLGRPTEIANVRFPKTGQIAKRYGRVPAATQTVEADVALRRIIGAGSSFLAVGKTPAGVRSWYTRYPSSDAENVGAGTLASLGTPPVPRAWVDNTAVSASSGQAQIVSIDAAIGLSQTCYAYRFNTNTGTFSGPNTYYSIVDNATGRTIVTDQAVNAWSSGAGTFGPGTVRVLAVPGSNSFLIGTTSEDTSGGGRVHLVSTAGTLGSQDMSGLNADMQWDWGLFGTTKLVICKHSTTANFITILTATVTASSLGNISQPTSINTTATLNKLAMCVPYSSSSTEDIVILLSEATNGFRGVTLSQAFATVQALWVIDSGTETRNFLTGARRADGTIDTWQEINNANDYSTSVRRCIATIGAAASTTQNLKQLRLGSKPVITAESTSSFIVLCHLSKTGTGATYGLQHARLLYEGNNVVGCFLRGDVPLPPSVLSVRNLPQICPAASDADANVVDEFACPQLRSIALTVDEAGTNDLRVVSSLRFKTDPRSGYVAIQDEDTLLVQGGYLALFDGTSAIENGFLLYPEILSVTASAGGSLPVSSSFDFVAVFFSIDARGRIHRSAPSQVKTGSTGATDHTMTVVVRGLVPSLKSSYGIELYRTEGDGSILYLAEAQFNKTVNNDDTVSFTITGSDATLIASTPLGQQAGLLDNAQPNCPIGLSSIGRRAQVIPGDDPYSLTQSKERRQGEGLAFFDTKSRRITRDGQNMGLATVGERWVAFKKRRLYLASGEGPDDSGQADTLSEFEAHPQNGIGCAYPRSIVTTNYGLVFRSEKGFYLLDPGGSLTYVGAGIDDYRDFPVTSAVFLEDRGEVHFLLLDGPILVLHLHETERGVEWRWSIDEQNDSAEAYGDVAVVDSRLYFAGQERNAGNPYSLYVEGQGTYYDQLAAYPVVMRITTGWIPITGELQGRGRLYRALFLGTVKAPHTARVRAAYDYVDTWIDDKSVTSANATTGGSAYQWEFRPSKQKIQAVRFEFTETLASASEGAVLNQLMLVVGVQPGAVKVQRVKRAA